MKEFSRVATEYDCDYIWPKIDIPEFQKLSNFCDEISEGDMDDENFMMGQIATEFIHKNHSRERYQRLRDVDLRCTKNTLMMLTPPSCGKGYLSAQDDILWKFLVDTRNELYKEIDDLQKPIADTMLMNPAKQLPAVVEITKNSLFVIDPKFYDVEAMHAAAAAYDFVMQIGFESADVNTISLKNKKTTSMGFPFETVDGDPVKKDDIVFGRESDLAYRSTRFITDWSEIKRGWREDLNKGCLGIFRNQIEFIKSGGQVNADNLASCIENQFISVHNNALRKNCPDAPVDGPESRVDAFGIYSKDRKGTIFTREGKQIDVVMNSKKVNSLADKLTHMPGMVNRERKIMPSNNMMHTLGTVLATSTVWQAEEGRKGNPSTRPSVMDDYNNFSYEMKQRGYHVAVLSGDCTNAEVTVTTNFEMLLNLVPERFRGYLDLTSHSIIPYKNWFRYMKNGYCSAVWYTTWFHIIKGNFECSRMSWYTLQKLGYNVDPLADCITRAIHCLFLSSEHPEILQEKFGDKFDPTLCSVSFGDDCWYNPKLATDDMVAQVATRKPIESIPAGVTEIAEHSMLAWDLGELVAFGMKIGDTLEENQGSRFAKMFTGEHMGFSYKDGMSTYIKLSECGHSDLINHQLKRYFGYGIEDYAPYLQQFASWLRDLGVQDGFYNEFSPSEKLLFGKYLGAGGSLGEIVVDNIRDKNSPIKFMRGSHAEQIVTRSARVGDEIVAEYLKELKSAFYG